MRENVKDLGFWVVVEIRYCGKEVFLARINFEYSEMSPTMEYACEISIRNFCPFHFTGMPFSH